MDRALIGNLWQCIGRRDTYAVQLESGTYARVRRALTEQDLIDHIVGRKTIGTYVIREDERCAFAVLDADLENGFFVLQAVAQQLLSDGGHLHLERSRRGGHAWLFFEQPESADKVRAWLAPIAQAHNLELYPKQATSAGVGSLIRVPLGIHRRSGTRYPFVDLQTLRAVARNTAGILAWLPSAAQSTCPTIAPATVGAPGKRALQFHHDGKSATGYRSIREWNAAQDPFGVIGRYVDLDRCGGGRCPFGEHHSGGIDDDSFQVYEPGAPGGYCWFCHTWDQGGSVFDFLRHYHGYTARELWQKIQTGGVF
jgi:hypothetical protein